MLQKHSYSVLFFFSLPCISRRLSILDTSFCSWDHSNGHTMLQRPEHVSLLADMRHEGIKLWNVSSLQGSIQWTWAYNDWPGCLMTSAHVCCWFTTQVRPEYALMSSSDGSTTCVPCFQLHLWSIILKHHPPPINSHNRLHLWKLDWTVWNSPQHMIHQELHASSFTVTADKTFPASRSIFTYSSLLSTLYLRNPLYNNSFSNSQIKFDFVEWCFLDLAV